MNVRVVEIIDTHKVSVVLKGNKKKNNERAPCSHLCTESVDGVVLCRNTLDDIASLQHEAICVHTVISTFTQ